MNEPKKLYRVEQGKMLAGVCGGLAEYFNIDPSLVRILWVVITVFTAVFPSLIAYFICAAILPRKSDIYPGY